MEIRKVKSYNQSYPKKCDIAQKDVEKCILNKWTTIPGITLLFNYFLKSNVCATATTLVSTEISGGRFFTNKTFCSKINSINDSYFCFNFWDLCINKFD